MKNSAHRHPCSAVTPIDTIHGYPSALRIFKIGCSPYWYARVWIHGKFRKASLKTDHKPLAIQRAKLFYQDQFGITDHLKKSISGHEFDVIAEAMMAEDERKVRRGERSESLVVGNRYAYAKHIKPYFQKVDVKSINYAVLEKFSETLEEKSLSSSSIKNFLSFIGKVLKYAHRQDLIERMPQMPTIKTKAKIRGWFSEQELGVLLVGMDKVIDSGLEVRGVKIQPDLKLLAELMVETMLRPSDVKQLKFQNIEIVEASKIYLRITTATSKTINSPVISTAAGVDVFRRIQNYQRSRGYLAQNNYLFFPEITERKRISEMLARQFAAVLDSLSMRQSPQGEPRTLYSLRHSSIMFAILRGDTNLLKIARNARTSPDMIDRFYARHLTAEMGE